MKKEQVQNGISIKTRAQSISKLDLDTIRMLHQRRLGWAYLLEETIGDKMVGFPCEAEEFFIRRQLKIAFNKVLMWFKSMENQYQWPTLEEGCMWEVDFMSSQAVSKKQSLQNEHTDMKKAHKRSLSQEKPLMTLGDMDLDIIKSLLERRAALADLVRSHLRLFLNGEFSLDELSEIVRQLGHAGIDVGDWFSKMATMYKWPSVENNKWRYRVDIAESQVFLEPKTACSC